METLNLQNLIEEPGTADLQETMPLLARIKEHQWWQGSLICASDLPDDLKTEGNDADLVGNRYTAL